MAGVSSPRFPANLWSSCALWGRYAAHSPTALARVAAEVLDVLARRGQVPQISGE